MTRVRFAKKGFWAFLFWTLVHKARINNKAFCRTSWRFLFSFALLPSWRLFRSNVSYFFSDNNVWAWQMDLCCGPLQYRNNKLLYMYFVAVRKWILHIFGKAHMCKNTIKSRAVCLGRMKFLRFRHALTPQDSEESLGVILNHQMNINSDSKPVARMANVLKSLRVPLR